jgi:predicted permease
VQRRRWIARTDSLTGKSDNQRPVFGVEIDHLWRDVLYAARGLRRSPVFSIVAIITLALGIGANTAVFSVVNAIIFRPLPVRDADRLAVIASIRSSTPRLGPVSFPDLQDYRAAATHDIFEDIAGYSVGFMGFAPERGRPDRVLVTSVTGNYFSLLGIQPAAGRLIRPEEGLPGRADPVVVLGHSAWHRRFGGDPAAIGRKAMLNGRPCTIVGVVPAEFVGTFAFSESEVYLPINWTDDRGARSLHTFARLRPEVTIERAQAAMDVVAARLEQEHPETDRGVKARVLPERLARPEEDNARSNAFGARVMLALVGLVLLVAEVNVTILLLARAATRRKERAIRAALGASRGRLIRQLFAESAMLAVLGGVAGVGLGTWAGRLLTMVRLPGDLPGSRLDFHLDDRVLAYAVTLTTATALLVGLIAARRALRGDVDEALHDYGQRSISLTGSHRIRKALVVLQIAVSFVLLVAGGLFMRSLSRAAHADFGFRPEGVLNIQMHVAQVGYAESRARSFFDEVQHRVARIAGVEDLAFAFSVPMGYVSSGGRLQAEGRPTASAERVAAGKNIVGPRYFATMGIPIESGRSFTEADDERTRPVAIVNRRLADVLWPGQAAIGRRFSQAGADGPWLEVVGVTATGKYRFLFEDPQPYFYVPLAQEYSGLRVLHVRTMLSPEALAPIVEREIHALEPDLPLYDVQSMTQALNSGYGLFAVRTGAFFAGILALLGLSLAVVGLNGMVSYMTSERTHEIGVRVALGADSRNIAAMVIGEGARLTVVGSAIGLAGALVLARVLSRLLFAVPPADPASFAAASLCVLAVALAATYLPARRATRVDPTVALRAE